MLIRFFFLLLLGCDNCAPITDEVFDSCKEIRGDAGVAEVTLNRCTCQNVTNGDD